jgi:hypothetical protein
MSGTPLSTLKGKLRVKSLEDFVKARSAVFRQKAADPLPDPAEIPARACTCSFCREHGSVWTAHPEASLEVLVNDPSRATKYEFGTRTAQYHACTRCGIVPVVTSCIDDRLYAVVNVNTFEGVDPSLFRHSTMTFDGKETPTRLARRKRNWISNVLYTERGT